MQELIGFLNGKYVQFSELKVSCFDEWTNQGLAVFEMTRSFRGETHLLTQHIDRLYKGLRYCGIPEPMKSGDMVKLCVDVVKANVDAMEDDDEHRLMITVSPGPRPIYQEFIPAGPTVCIADFPLRYTVKGMGSLYAEGVHLQSSPYQAYPTQCISSRVKHRSRLHFALAAQLSPWSLLYDQQGYVAEGPGFAVMVLVNGAIFIPRLHYALPSISRDFILQLAIARGLSVHVMDMDRSILCEASEIWITATPFCVLPVTKVDGRVVGNGTPGSFYHVLLKDWSQKVKVNIPEQVKAWG